MICQLCIIILINQMMAFQSNILVYHTALLYGRSRRAYKHLWEGYLYGIPLFLSPSPLLSCVIYLSYLSTYLLSNIYYIYNKYSIYLSLPYNLYTHDHICSIFITDYVIIQLISNDLSHISHVIYLLSPWPIVWMDMSIDWLMYRYGDIWTGIYIWTHVLWRVIHGGDPSIAPSLYPLILRGRGDVPSGRHV